MIFTQVIPGTLKPDGTLELHDKVKLPPGDVQVIVQAAHIPDDAKDPFMARMEAMWALQKARGHKPRSVEEIEAERKAFRDESEEEMREIEQLYEECVRARKAREQTE